MGYRNLQSCVVDLERTQQLIRIDTALDPRLEIGAVQRRVYQAGGPALLFTQVKGSRFPMLGNLFGTMARARYVFRDTLETIQKLVTLKTAPEQALKQLFDYRGVPKAAWHLRPKKVSQGPVLAERCQVSDLPQLISWPNDGGAFITLPQVYSEHPASPGFAKSNLGMYRIQISGNDYQANEEVGLHYQTHRSIGVHHEAALRSGKNLRVNVFVGGAPSMTLAAVMPLPEGMTELAFGGVLGGHRIPMVSQNKALPLYAEADFCLQGTILPQKLLREGPFGDHLGYYSLEHDFPVLKVEQVYHRKDPIWLFTTVGRPPQEDTVFGELIHELTGPLIPDVLPGVKQVNAVDAAGVHPLLLAIGSERYTPYQEFERPQEILTQANAILGQGQLSLAKYLWISNHQDNPNLNANDIPAFFKHMLERVDWMRDLHFQTKTTIDTLDYSGSGLNEGSKLVIAAVGPKKRELPIQVPSHFTMPEGFSKPQVCLPGILAVQGPKYDGVAQGQLIPSLVATLNNRDFPLIVIVDDSEFAARHINNFLWITFTRSNPSHDIYGVDEFTENKHWGCHGPLIIDARIKPHHAPPLEDDPEIEKRVDALAAPGKPLHGII